MTLNLMGIIILMTEWESNQNVDNYKKMFGSPNIFKKQKNI